MTQFLFAEALESRLLLNAQMISWLQDSAQNVTVGPIDCIRVEGTIQGGKDVYQFTASATGKVTVDLFGGSGLDSYLTIFNAKGKKIRANDNAFRGTLDSRVKLSVKAGQTYYIVAEGKSGTEGEYVLAVLSQPRDDAGNTLDAAKKLGNASSKTARIDYAGDVDVFSFTAKATGTMTLSMLTVGKTNLIDAKLTILDARGQVIATSDETTATAVVTFTVQAGQTYYIQAESTNDATGKYKLVRSKIGPSPTAKPDSNPTAERQPTFDLPQAPTQANNTITTEIITTVSGLQLVICGTDGNDTIILSQTAKALTLTTATGTYVFDGDFTSIVVFGFSGNDTIQFTATVTAQGCLYGGEGNDRYYLAGSGATWVYGGEGDDHYVTVGGGTTVITSGPGFNSYWVSSYDVITDATAAELKAGTVHRVTEFYQPWANKADYIPLTPGGETFRNPDITSSAKGYADFSNNPLFVNGPKVSDINQGAVGDCYFLASLASIANGNPMLLQQAVTPLGDGTYAVRFYRYGQEVYLRVDGYLPVTSGRQLAYAKTGQGGATWVAIMEKAYAFFRSAGNSYASISGGWMANACTDLTGLGTTSLAAAGSASSVYAFLQTQLADGKAVTAASTSTCQGPIVASHAYSILSVQMIGNTMTVTVYNPWGFDGSSTPFDSNPNDGQLVLSIAQFQQYFGTIVSAKAA